MTNSFNLLNHLSISDSFCLCLQPPNKAAGRDKKQNKEENIFYTVCVEMCSIYRHCGEAVILSAPVPISVPAFLDVVLHSDTRRSDLANRAWRSVELSTLEPPPLLKSTKVFPTYVNAWYCICGCDDFHITLI